MRTSYAIAAAMVAMASNATASPFDGFYVGGQLGHNSTEVGIKKDWTPASYDLSANGAEYGVYAGYGQVMSGNLYLGAEVEANLSSAENKLSAGADTLKTEKEHSYGAAIRAGYATGNVMPYARLGYNHNKYKASTTGTLTASDTDSKGGLSYGAGLEWRATDQVALRTEIVRTNVGKFSDTDGTNTLTVDPTETVARVGVAMTF